MWFWKDELREKKNNPRSGEEAGPIHGLSIFMTELCHQDTHVIYIFTFICGMCPKMCNLVKDCLLLCSCIPTVFLMLPA
jgi:hypothetical protein